SIPEYSYPKIAVKIILITNPTSPMIVMPSKTTRVISRTSVKVGLRASRNTRFELVMKLLNLSI
ncbi:MAG: hypothetical protein LUQ65_09180, partial [Candidatus Helarchaeota archaeon]|nr:hypothetical protein [Candidatus Helarchaeota archaeon]